MNILGKDLIFNKEIMSERLDRIEKLLEKAVIDTAKLKESQAKTDEQIQELKESQIKTDEQMKNTSKELDRVWKKIDKLWKLYWNSENNKW
jgi:septal ring factor EnvC (AmiA/AmiB activator)